MEHRHTFVICAYRDSPHLAACIESLRQQTVPSALLLATSTPSPFLEAAAREHGFEYHVNPAAGGGIAADWNFALSRCRTPYATIAHQDDIYLPDYAAEVTAAFERNDRVRLVFTDYADLLPGDRVLQGRPYLLVKRLLLWPFYLRRHWRAVFVKKWILRFGCPVCCPSAGFHTALPGELSFDRNFTVNPDWAMWLHLAEEKNTAFAYCPKPLLLHRISDGMETAAAIRDRRRADEDLRLFSRLWPRPLARLLAGLYALSYRSNRPG